MPFFLIGMREGEELKTPRHASAAATRDDRLPHSRQFLFEDDLFRYEAENFRNEPCAGMGQNTIIHLFY